MTLTADIRYDKLGAAFNENFKGFNCKTTDEIRQAFQEALKRTDKPTIINVVINPSADRKAQEFPWLTKSKI